ncbi:MAG: hypothetical protein WC792_01255 [Candidatus Micrarchaeia archaeon]|jgi:hypothetical protein
MAFSRAFIAAPLIGSIMFLVATVFVVGMVTSESQEVNRATVDAYHGKLVSMLELYRLDLYSLFVDGLRQNVEDFLAGIPWVNLNAVGANSPADIAQKRYDNCRAMKDAIRSQIVSSGSGLSDKNFLNGLSDLLGKLRDEFNFEGVTFAPVKFGNWNFTCTWPSSGGVTGRSLCEALIPSAQFDCQNFAVNTASPYRCCAEDNGHSACPSGKVVADGCDNGGFLLSVDLANSQVFRYMPRIDATDGAGNEIRSGALGEKPLSLRIRYPIFKYRHVSFGFFEKLQFEGGVRPADFKPRKFGEKIKEACGYLGDLRNRGEADPQYANLTARIWLSDKKFVKCRSETDVSCCSAPSSCSNCPANLGKFISKELYGDEDDEGHTITVRTPKVEFYDGDPRFRVNPQSENVYAWDAQLNYPSH